MPIKLLATFVVGLFLACFQAGAAPLLINAQQPNDNSTPQHIRDNYAYIESLKPLDGMVVRTPSGWNLMNGQALTYTQIAADFAPMDGLVFTRMKNNFAIVPVDRPADFFDSWATTIQNFRLLARVLKEKGFVGIVLDTEEYKGFLWNYPDNCSYPTKTLTEYSNQAAAVGAQVMQAMKAEFPAIQVIAYFGPASSFPGAPPKAAGGNSGQLELMGPFEVGMIGATDAITANGSLFVDGGEVYNLRGVGDFQDSYLYRKTTFATNTTNCPFIPSALRDPVWGQKVSVSFGVYNLGYEPMSPDIMRTTLANALARCDKYVWLYFEGLDWNTPGGITQDWVSAVEYAKSTVVPTGPVAPSVSLTSPANNSRLVMPASVSLTASAADADGTIAKVEFFAGATKLGEDTTAPYSLAWNSPAAGNYVLTAKATDNSGLSTTSAPIALSVVTTVSASINFQAPTTAVPSGYLADSGNLFADRGNGLSYGWNVNHTDETRDRGGSTDPRLASLIQMHSGGTWEIAVPNGAYNVTVSVGDGGFASSYTLNVEGVNYWTNQSLAAAQFASLTKTVMVSDGRLTINQGAAPEESTRINYVLLSATTAGTVPAAPDSLTIIAATSSTLNLAWRDNSTDEVGFRVERSTSSAFTGATLVASLPAGTVSFRDASLAASTAYYYRVSAYNNSGSSAYATATGSTLAPVLLVPAAPAGVTATAGDAKVSLAWSAGTGATSYSVKRSTTSGGPYATVQSGTATSAVDSGLTNGTTYYYVVTASNAAGESVNSVQVGANPAAVPTAPAAPSGLAATAGDARVTLAWTAPVGATAYSVKRSTTNGGPYTVLTTSNTTVNYTDTPVTNGTTYYYVVAAWNGSLVSADSTQVSAVPVAPVTVAKPDAPAALNATAGDTRVTLSWPASTGATSYGVKRATTSGGPYTLVSSAVTALTYADAAVVNGITYYYVVSARNTAGEGVNSVQTGATPRVPLAAPPAPTGLQATPVAGRISLRWNAVSGATGYNVRRATNTAGPYTLIAAGVATNSCVDDSAVAGTPYSYNVTAIAESVASTAVTATSTAAFNASVNFQGPVTVTPAGYVADGGDVYGLRTGGLSYGWNVNHTDEARDRGGSTDPRLASLVQVHAGGVWEIALPNGTYNVTVGIGDGGFPSAYTVNVEGANYWNAQSLIAAQFVSMTKAVTVTDGRLTIDQGAGAETATRLDYLIISGL